MQKSRTGSVSKFRVIHEPGTVELPKQRARMQTDLFLATRFRKGRRKGK